MSIEAHITAADGWHRYEAKALRFTVVDDAGQDVALAGLSLEWKLMREPGSSVVYLTKTSSSGITVENTNEAVVSIDDSEYEGDPDLVAGIYYHELWDRTNDVLLSYGDVTLLPGSEGS